MIVCSQCGYQNDDDDQFCGGCPGYLPHVGTYVEDDSPPVEVAQDATEEDPVARRGLVERVKEMVGGDADRDEDAAVLTEAADGQARADADAAEREAVEREREAAEREREAAEQAREAAELRALEAAERERAAAEERARLAAEERERAAAAARVEEEGRAAQEAAERRAAEEARAAEAERGVEEEAEERRRADEERRAAEEREAREAEEAAERRRVEEEQAQVDAARREAEAAERERVAAEERERAEEERKAAEEAERRAAAEAEERARRAAAMVAKPPPPAAAPASRPRRATQPLAAAAPADATAPETAAAEADVAPRQPTAQQPAPPRPRPPTKKIAPTRDIEPGDLVCGQCGEPNKPERRFCRRCAASLDEAKVAKVPLWKRIFRRRGKKVAAGERPGRKRGVKGALRSAQRRRAAFRRWFRRLIAIAAIVGLAGAIGPWRGGLQERGIELYQSLRERFSPQYINATIAEAHAKSEASEEHLAKFAVDGADNRHWLAGEPGEGQWLRVRFEEATDLRQVGFLAGASGDAFLSHPRPRDLHLVFDSGETADITLIDQAEFQSHPIEAHGVTEVQIHIRTLHPTTEDDNRVAITNVQFVTTSRE